MKRDLANKEDLYRILSEFYDALRKDEILSHFFVKFNDDQVLMQHLSDLSDFWEQSLFYTGTYTKNVMQIHQEVDQKDKMEEKHMQRWLELFRRAVDDNFNGTQAERLKNRALSIATVMRLKMGL